MDIYKRSNFKNMGQERGAEIMKKAFKKLFNFLILFFSSYWKVKKMEISIITSLTTDYINYQENKDIELLHRLLILVSFCKANGINGSTTKIQDEIIKEWEDRIIKK